MSTTGKQPMDIGHEIADILLTNYPEQGHEEEISSVIMHVLERYSIEIEGPGESSLAAIMGNLEEKLKVRFLGT